MSGEASTALAITFIRFWNICCSKTCSLLPLPRTPLNLQRVKKEKIKDDSSVVVPYEEGKRSKVFHYIQENDNLGNY